MNIHQTTGRWLLGLSLALITAFFWGLLPILLKGLLANTDPYTITWYRFLVAGGIAEFHHTRWTFTAEYHRRNFSRYWIDARRIV